jgi:hypothetical protein
MLLQYSEMLQQENKTNERDEAYREYHLRGAAYPRAAITLKLQK